MSKKFALVVILFACLVGLAYGQDDGGGDFSVSSSDYTYNGSNGCAMGYCDTTIDSSAWDGVSQRFIDGVQASQVTWQDGVPIPTSQVQAQASTFQQALSAVADDSQVPISTAPLTPSLDNQGQSLSLGPGMDGLEVFDRFKTIWDFSGDMAEGKVTKALGGLAGLGSLPDILIGEVLDPPPLNQDEFPPGWQGTTDTMLESLGNGFGPNTDPPQSGIISDNSLQDLQNWLTMQQMLASLNQRDLQTPSTTVL